jgi:hypothetical protein
MRTTLNAIVLGTGALVAALTVVGCGTGQAAPAQSTQSSQGAQVASVQSSGGGACTTTDLSAKLGTRKQLPVDSQGELGAAGAHYRIDLVWTNTSHSACTLRGFGGVDLNGPNLGQAGGPT